MAKRPTPRAYLNFEQAPHGVVAPTKRPTPPAYLHFKQAPHGVVVAPTQTSPAAAGAGAGEEEFDEADIWGVLAPSVEPADPSLATRKASPAKPAPALAPDGKAAHGSSLPINIPDWSKILGSAYRPVYRYGFCPGDWDLDDDEDSVDMVPPHVLVWRRRATSLSLSGVVGRSLKVRDAVWKSTTGFQD